MHSGVAAADAAEAPGHRRSRSHGSGATGCQLSDPKHPAAARGGLHQRGQAERGALSRRLRGRPGPLCPSRRSADPGAVSPPEEDARFAGLALRIERPRFRPRAVLRPGTVPSRAARRGRLGRDPVENGREGGVPAPAWSRLPVGPVSPLPDRLPAGSRQGRSWLRSLKQSVRIRDRTAGQFDRRQGRRIGRHRHGRPVADLMRRSAGSRIARWPATAIAASRSSASSGDNLDRSMDSSVLTPARESSDTISAAPE